VKLLCEEVVVVDKDGAIECEAAKKGRPEVEISSAAHPSAWKELPLPISRGDINFHHERNTTSYFAHTLHRG
jgi:hypothetical protein